MKTVNNKKVKSIMETARELFWKHGLKRVSIEEICQKSGVSKMTFYRHFDNKTELAKAIFEIVINDSIQKFKAIMSDESTTTAHKMEAMIKLKLEGTNDISKEFLQDFYSSPELGMVDYINQRTYEVWQYMLNDFKTAQQKGWFRKDFNPETFFYLSQKMSEMVNDPTLLSMYNSPQDLVMEITKLFTYGIMPYQKK
jgi:AcrR family transcriptional regulator